MSEQSETPIGGLKKQLNEMQQDIKTLSKDVLELTLINKHQSSLGEENAKEIDLLKADSQTAKGAISLFKIIGAITGGSIIAFFTWIVSSGTDTQQRISDTNQKVAILESKLVRLDTDISVLRGEKNEQ